MKIDAKKVHELLENASAVIIDGDALVYPALTGPDDVDGEVAYFSWTDGEGLYYSFRLTEEGCVNADFDPSTGTITCKDHMGQDTQIQILVPCKERRGNPEHLVICSLCGGECPKATAHLHQGQFIGGECCWDDRLKASE